MSQTESGSSENQQSQINTLELYKTAHARLTFQDEYLFKFSALFLTAHGALATLAGSAIFLGNAPKYWALLVISITGVLLAKAWSIWTKHNDYWHSVWTGVLRQIEKTNLNTNARVFDLDHDEIAKGGKRGKLTRSGHAIAQLVPDGLLIAWILTLVAAAFGIRFAI
jgi:hypothetical protein